uniref:Uncharacterized protein n=1 Tax=Strigamia maritima TaxID=126957 RepID=T1JDX8_STRMM
FEHRFGVSDIESKIYEGIKELTVVNEDFPEPEITSYLNRREQKKKTMYNRNRLK